MKGGGAEVRQEWGGGGRSQEWEVVHTESVKIHVANTKLKSMLFIKLCCTIRNGNILTKSGISWYF